MRFSLLLFVALLLSPWQAVDAQEDKWEGGLFLGAGNYAGDIIKSDLIDVGETNFAYGVMVKHNLSETFGLRLGLYRGEVGADDLSTDDEFRTQRGFSFENGVTELSLLGQWEPFGGKRYSNNGNFKQILSPYLFAGVGLAFSNPDVDFNGRTNARVAMDMAEDVQQSLITVPFGLGVRYDLNSRWNLGVEFGWRPVFNDYLDGVSESANPEDNDWYMFGGLTLTTRFGTKDTDGDGIADDMDDCPNIAGIASVKGCPDTDLDGVKDSKDACPEIAGDAKYSGCPDSDGDDVADHQDNCPDTPGVRRFRGCPDTDEDGIPDPTDICPTIAGIAALDGCPDSDRDGITDADDACPELFGIAAANGCPDTDGDGIIDTEDACPEQPGTSAMNGCPDTDGDGLHDANDACPTNAGPASNNGCPEISQEDLSTLELAMSNIRFETGRDILLSASNRILDEIAEIMSRYSDYSLKISGYTDNVGSEVSNQNLSERRATVCLNYLANKGVARNRMSASGYGETNPIADNKTVAGRARNRRTEFQLVPPRR